MSLDRSDERDRPVLRSLARRLETLREQDLERGLTTATGIDFTSNDYLALSGHVAVKEGLSKRLSSPQAAAGTAGEGSIGLGAPGSRLLRGHTAVHERFERRFARWKGMESALLYPSGWQANVGLLTTVVRPEDRVLSDAANHASLIDALRLCRCRKVIFPHLDVEAVRSALAEPHDGHTFLVTESLYSMDGDIAPLDRYVELCEQYGAELIVDDAHGTGLYGAEARGGESDASPSEAGRGSGLAEYFGVEDRLLALTSTGGKALGLGGALVAGSALLRDLLVSTSRPFVFSTAVPPLLVHALDAALDVLEREPWRRHQARSMAERLRGKLRSAGIEGIPEGGALGGPIVPVGIGGNRAALEVAERIRLHGFDVRAVRPPTVAPGTARLRISVHADHTAEQIDRLAEVVIAAIAEVAGKKAPLRSFDPPEGVPSAISELVS